MKRDTTQTLDHLWNKCEKDLYLFIEVATNNGFGLFSIKEFLDSKGVSVTYEEIDKIRCPLLYLVHKNEKATCL